MILSIEAEEKCGKSTMAYTAPLPIVGFSFDLGHDRAINGTMHDEWFKGLKIETILYKQGEKPVANWNSNDITIYQLPRPIQLDSDKVLGFRELWNYFIILFSKAVEDDSISTVVIDTMTLCRRIKNDAYLQELQVGGSRKQLLQIEYSHPNDELRNIYDLLKALDKNAVVTHHLTDEYGKVIKNDGTIDTQPTGKRLLEGLTGTYRHIDAAIRLERKQGDIQGTIVECGHNIKLVGNPVAANWDAVVGMIEGSLGGRVRFDHRKEQAAAK